MKALHRYIILTLCLLLGSGLAAQPAGNALFDIVRTDDGGYTLHFSLGDVALLPAAGDTALLQVAGLPSPAPRAGLPALPQACLLLALPPGSHLRTDQLLTEHTTLMLADSGYHWLSPYAGAAAKDAPEPHAVADKEVYASSEAYRAGEFLHIQELGTMGSLQLVRISVHPAVYRPQEGSLQMLTRLDATLTAIGQPLPRHETLPQRYLIVSRPEYRDGLQPFVRWKRQEGYDVVELYASTHLRDSIKALIAPFFANPGRVTPPAYLLLVGDVAQIQSFVGTEVPTGFNTHSTDLYYAEHTGDGLPDAMTGRWSVNDTAQLGAIVRKTIRYEQGHGLDTAQLRRVLLVAGAEQRDPAPVTTNGQVNYLGREIKLAHPALDTTCYRNPASGAQREAILNDIAQGTLFVGYTAHCTNAGWNSPNITYNNIDTLTENQPTVYINNCCNSNDFSGTCFGEQLLRKPQGGAVGVIGATNSTLWNEDYYWAVGPKYPFSLQPAYDATRAGAFDGWLGQLGGTETLGQLLLAGNLAVTAFGSPYDRFYWEIYCLLGDPSLRLLSGVPTPIALQVTGSVNGATAIDIDASAGAIVTALQGDTLMGVARIDSSGHGQLLLRQALDTRPLVITATGTNLLPLIDTIAVALPEGPAATLRHVVTTDSSVLCTVENTGSQRLGNLRLNLSQDASDMASGAWIAEQNVTLDTIGTQEQATVALPVSVTATATQWQATLRLLDDNDSLLCQLPVSHSLPVTRPTATFRLLAADSSAAQRLQASSHYLLAVTTEGQVDTMTLAASALPTTDTLLDTTSLSPLSPLSSFLFHTPDTLTHLLCQASLQAGAMHEDYSFYIVGGHGMDCFEEGFDSYPWQTGGTVAWQIDSNVRHSGKRCLRSGVIDYRQTSDLSIDLMLPQADSISFWLQTSTEARYDKLLFSIDGETVGSGVSGTTAWRRYSYLVPAGRHSLRWRYVKDESNAAGSDCVWLDDVTLPLALWDAPYGWFGNPATLSIDPIDAHRPTLNIYPNPTAGQVHLGNQTAGTLQVLDLYGHQLYVGTQQPYSTLDLSALVDGLYILHFSTTDGNSIRKILIQH